MKKLIIFTLITLLPCITKGASLKQIQPGFAKNIILFIPNGNSTTLANITRTIYGDKPLALDSLSVGNLKENSPSFDLSLLAIGEKNKSNLNAPTATLLEGAKNIKKSIGIITPSSTKNSKLEVFTSHVNDPQNYNAIIEQRIYQNFDILMGGELSYFNENKALLENIKNEGYNLIYNLDTLNKINEKKLVALFSPLDMSPNLDRNRYQEPSLDQMTAKAIELLSKNKDGFFLVIEGSPVNSTNLLANPVTQISEFNTFDKAIGEALEFAKKDKNTLIVVAPNNFSNEINLEKSQNKDFIKIIKSAKNTERKVARMILKNPQFTKAIVKDNLGITLSENDVKKIKSIKNLDELQKFLGDYILKSAQFSQSKKISENSPQKFYTYFSNSAQILTEPIQASDLNTYLSKAMNLNLKDLSKKLFISGKTFKERGLNLRINDIDRLRTEFTVTIPKDRSRREYIFFQNRNYFEVNGVKHRFNGIVVYNDGEVFFPEEALNMIKK